MKTRKSKAVLTAIVCLAVLACVFAIWKLHTNAPAPVAANPGWKLYQNKEFDFSFEYPPTFELREDRNADGDSFMVRISDPSTHAGYIFVTIWLRQHNKDEISEYFTGPYPKVIPAKGNNSDQTVVERMLGGVQGVEYYGYGGEGTSYDDVFLYENNYLWGVALDGVMEGRIAEEREPGAPVPDKDTYDRIRASIRIRP